MLCIQINQFPCEDKSDFEGYSAHWQAYLWEANSVYRGILERKDLHRETDSDSVNGSLADT
ncbi:hypothetical protein MXB_1597 [Myxobolus squamalis]|nr:hypothetical protein MXB_1597 [Myxobolus squamalis]